MYNDSTNDECNDYTKCSECTITCHMHLDCITSHYGGKPLSTHSTDERCGCTTHNDCDMHNGAAAMRADERIQSQRPTDSEYTVDSNGATTMRANERVQSPPPIDGKDIVNPNGATTTRANERVKSPRPIDGKDIVHSCNTHECPVDGTWFGWSYGACSKNCGTTGLATIFYATADTAAM